MRRDSEFIYVDDRLPRAQFSRPQLHLRTLLALVTYIAVLLAWIHLTYPPERQYFSLGYLWRFYYPGKIGLLSCCVSVITCGMLIRRPDVDPQFSWRMLACAGMIALANCVNGWLDVLCVTSCCSCTGEKLAEYFQLGFDEILLTSLPVPIAAGLPPFYILLVRRNTPDGRSLLFLGAIGISTFNALFLYCQLSVFWGAWWFGPIVLRSR